MSGNSALDIVAGWLFVLVPLGLCAVCVLLSNARSDADDRTEDVDLDSGQGSEPRTDTRPPGGAHLPRVTPGSASSGSPDEMVRATSPRTRSADYRLRQANPDM